MADYNPDDAKILGNEWVPIKQADYLPDVVTERGYTFSIADPVTVVSGSYNVSATFPPALPGTGRIANFLALYPAGQETLTGPIEEVIIPVSAVSITGSGTSVIGAANEVAALASPYDGGIVQFTSASQVDFGMSFDMVPYSQQLYGKRILNVSFLYQIASLPSNLQALSFSIRRAVPVSATATHASGSLEGPLSLNTPGPVKEIVCGDLNPHWNSAVTDPWTTTEIYPWRYTELALFAATAGLTRLIGMFQIGVNDASRPVQLGYVAMKVTYCEETRVRYGGDRKGSITGSTTPASFAVGSSLVRMRDTGFVSGTSLPAGDYTLASVYRNIFGGASTAAMIQTAIRQLYEIPSIQGVDVSESTTVGATFTKARSDILPQLALHTAAGVVTGSHVYGTQIGAPVYGTITATQDIDADSAAGQQYPQARFYARRFGTTTAPLVLRSVAAPTTFVQITVDEFDALPEIVDGWREVTLRFTTIPTFTAPTAQAWKWDALGETAGNQWQVLGADGPSFTGTQSYAAATYFAPNGSTVNLDWQAPAISGVAADTISDAVLMFAQDPPTVTGFTLTPSTQAVTGIGLSCGVSPRCIPTGISYTRVSWNMGVVCHTFGTDAVDGWTNADTGQAPTVVGGAAADFDQSGGVGTIAVSATGSDRSVSYNVGNVDQDITVLLKANSVPAGGTAQQGVFGRVTDTNNYYLGIISVDTAGVISARIAKRVAGVLTNLVTFATIYTNGADTMLRFQIIGSQLQLKVWPAALDEPGAWTTQIVDTSLTTGTGAGAFARREAGNTAPTVYSFDDFTAVPGNLVNSSYELQRFDALDNEWQTIMDTENLCTIAFNDYEARVGVLSSYRIRVCDVLDFCGPWTTGSATIPAPGITGSGSGAGVLIFTSNSNQAGAYNLAYRMQWETGGAQEDFSFPEARSVTLQDMYNKDFPTAFRPTERGGEQFSRALLVQGAAISAESLANFKSLRDMAWADLPYVAVRDELGNRWYATVIVPGGNVRRNRTLYFAQVDVIEVTDTAAPVSMA